MLRADTLFFNTLTIYPKKNNKQTKTKKKFKKNYEKYPQQSNERIHISFQGLMFTQGLLGVELKSLL